MAACMKGTSWFMLFALFLKFSLISVAISDKNEQTLLNEFNEFIVKYRKSYKEGTREYERRFNNFKESLKRHTLLNKKKPSNDTDGALYGVNKFSDLSQAEFEQLYLNNNIPSKVHITNSFYGYNRQKVFPGIGGFLGKIPLKVDWRTKNVVSPVRNQKSCGGCWAFSTVETIESAYAMKTNRTPPVLSVQQVIDCAVYGNYGCKGGSICQAMFWMNYTSVKLVTDKEYPLTDTSEYCKMEPPGLVGIKGYHCNSYMGRAEYFLLVQIALGPVAASVDARTWNDYLGGIIKYHCSKHNNHAVQIVGYDLSGPVPYYIIRNSWGTDFGNDGYIYVKYGDNMCGIGAQIGIPVL